MEDLLARDLTQGALTPTLLLFALPTLASSVIQSTSGTLNSYFVGRFLGEGALAATANGNIAMFLLVVFVFGFDMAATDLCHGVCPKRWCAARGDG